MKSSIKKTILVILLLLALILVIIGVYFLVPSSKTIESKEYALIFRKNYATELGLDWQRTYTTMLDDFNVKLIKISVPWNEVEKIDDQFTFQDYDWMVNEAGQRNKKVILAFGQKSPGWPECHLPLWAKSLDKDNLKKQVLDLNENLVKHFKDNQAIYAWQVENEPLLKVFGACPDLGRSFLKEEIQAVRDLDPERIAFTTDSGELSLWLMTGSSTDILGVSIYRTVWNKYIGYFRWPLLPSMYRRKADLALMFLGNLKEVWISEYQLEPWSDKSLVKTPLDRQEQALPLEKFKKDLEFAKEVQFKKVFFWGGEWWIWRKDKTGDSSYYNAVKEFLRDNQ